MKTEFQKCMDGEIFDGKDKELAEMNDISPLADLRIGQTIKVPNR